MGKHHLAHIFILNNNLDLIYHRTRASQLSLQTMPNEGLIVPELSVVMSLRNEIMRALVRKSKWQGGCF